MRSAAGAASFATLAALPITASSQLCYYCYAAVAAGGALALPSLPARWLRPQVFTIEEELPRATVPLRVRCCRLALEAWRHPSYLAFVLATAAQCLFAAAQSSWAVFFIFYAEDM